MTKTAPTAHSQRINMALGQLTTNDIIDQRLLNAIVAVPRENFVPEKLAGSAYVDEDIALGNRRFLLAPLSFSRLLALAEVKPGEKVLVVGCATGYSLAVLAQLGTKVIGCDTDDALVKRAQENMKALGYADVTVEKVPTLADGYVSGAPYDKIIVEGAVPAVPESLTDLLTEGGKLVAAEAPRGGGELVQGFSMLVEYACLKTGVFRHEQREIAVPMLPGFAHTSFTFLE